MKGTLQSASENLAATGEGDIEALLALPVNPASEVVVDKGYHSNGCLEYLDSELVRTYISEPDRGRRDWAGKEHERDLVYANRRRIKGGRGKRLFRLRAELCERAYAHLFTTGGMRRTYLHGHANILKRLLVHTCGFSLGLVLRTLFKAGTPRGMYELIAACFDFMMVLIARPRGTLANFDASRRFRKTFHLIPREEREPPDFE